MYRSSAPATRRACTRCTYTYVMRLRRRRLCCAYVLWRPEDGYRPGIRGMRPQRRRPLRGPHPAAARSARATGDCGTHRRHCAAWSRTCRVRAYPARPQQNDVVFVHNTHGSRSSRPKSITQTRGRDVITRPTTTKGATAAASTATSY